MRRVFSNGLLRASGWVVLLGLLIGLAGAVGSVLLYSNLRPDFEELLPQTARSVHDLKDLSNRVVGTDYIAVLAFAPDPTLSEDFLDKLAASLRNEPPQRIGRIEWNISDTIRFFKERASLFLPVQRVRELSEYVSQREQYEKDLRNPMKLFAEEPTFDFDALEKDVQARSKSVVNFPGGYFANRERSVYTLLAYLPDHKSKISASYALRDTLEQHISEVIKANPRFKVVNLRFTGGVQDLIEEHSSLMKDVGLTAIVVFVLVLVVCWIYYGSLQALFLLALTILVGSFSAFGLAYLIEGYVNANSAFLGSIVIGNGINFGIIFLARFTEEMRKRKGHLRAVMIALRRTDSATAVAAAAAALSYGALMATDFRGFRQFGLIGCLGMACCWVAAYTFLPSALVVWGKRFRFHFPTGQRNWFGFGLSRFVSRFSSTILAISVAATLASALGLYLHSGDLLETNMSRLRDRRSEAEGSGYYSRYLHEIFGYPHPTIILASSHEEATEITKRLREQVGKPNSWIADVHSIDDFLPESMLDKAAILRQIREKVDHLGWNHLRGVEKDRAKDLLREEGLHAFEPEDLPEFVLQRFREKDGSIGRMVLVEPPHSGAMEEGKFLHLYVEQVRGIVDSVRPGIPVTGQLPLSSDLEAAISYSGPRVTALAFIFVLIFLVLLFRKPKHVVPLVASLVFGTLWLIGLTIAGGHHINFVNFIAFPITLGISVDYSINIYQRYLQDQSVTASLVQSGGAVFLASLTTIIGYGALLFAGNQAISSFGALATYGEIAGLTAALITLPAYLVRRERLGHA